MSKEAKPYPQLMWEGFTAGEPGQCEYDSLSDRYRERCDRGTEAVIAAYEADRRKDAEVAAALLAAQVRDAWKLIRAVLCGHPAEEAAVPTDPNTAREDGDYDSCESAL